MNESPTLILARTLVHMIDQATPYRPNERTMESRLRHKASQDIGWWILGAGYVVATAILIGRVEGYI